MLRTEALRVQLGLEPGDASFFVAGDPAKAGERLRDAVAARRDKPARPPRVLPDVDTAVAARLVASRMSPEAARLIVERNLREVEGGFAWRSDPRLTLPGHVRMDEVAVQSLLRAIEAPVLVVAAEPSPPYFTAAVREARLACLRENLDPRAPARLPLLFDGDELMAVANLTQASGFEAKGLRLRWSPPIGAQGLSW